jgi:DNA-binding MarR family transcriptional regulator
MELDRIIHEPVRLRIMAMLSGVDTADFKFLVSTLGLSKGNLSSHVDKLEAAGYVRVTKSFNGKITNTQYALTAKGRKALEKHWTALDDLRAATKSKQKSEAIAPLPRKSSTELIRCRKRLSRGAS